MPKNIILKIKKILSLKKLSKKLQKLPKKGQKWPFFGPGDPNFAKIKKSLDILLLLPQRGCIPNFRKFGSSPSDLEKALQTDKRTDDRTY